MGLAHKIVNRIEAYDDFREVINVIRQNAYGPIYLVGGKVYRTAIETIHGGDVGAARVDWDVLVMGDVKPNFIPPGWHQNGYNAAAKPNSICLKKRSSGYIRSGGYAQGSTYVNTTSHKIDLIGIKDIPGGDLAGYFNVVPLNVQRIALDLDRGRLHGVEGVRAINEKFLRVNSSTGCLPGLHIASYIRNKAASLNFAYDGQITQKTPCDCYPGDSQALWNYGCKLPKFHT